MKSRQLVRFHENLSDLNTNYSHFLFIAEEFANQSKGILDKYPEGTEIKDVFKDNPYASQFNVKVGLLDFELENTKQFILRGLFLLSYFQYEVYLRDIYNYLKLSISNLPELSPKVAVNTQITNNLGLESLDPDERDTMEYLKLRRNALVHRDSTRVSQGELLDIVKQKGKALNTYWEKRSQSKKEPTITSLDFTEKGEELYHLRDREVIDMLNIIRRLSERVDEYMLSKIDPKKFRDTIREDFEKTYDNNFWC